LYQTRIDTLPRELQSLAHDNETPVLAELATPLEIQKFFHAGGLHVASAGNRPLVAQRETVFDPGEAEAISLAVERAPSLLLIDERDGRQVA
jgi:predicted nucleic acid-binding protein